MPDLLSAFRAARRDGYTAAKAFALAPQRLAAFKAAEEAKAAAYALPTGNGPEMEAKRAAAARASRQWTAAYHGAVAHRSTWSKPAPLRAGQDSDRPGSAFIERPASCFRFARHAARDGSRGHSGWFTDPDGGDTVEGVVYRLNHGRGFVYGYADPFQTTEDDRTGPALLILRPVADEDEAARRADRMAQSVAEDMREHEEAYREGRDAREAYREHAAKIRASVAEVRERREDVDAARALAAPALPAALAALEAAREALCDVFEDRPRPRPEWSWSAYVDGYRAGWADA